MSLFHSVDSNSIRPEKYLEHATPVIKLIPREVRDAMRRLRKELPPDDGE